MNVVWRWLRRRVGEDFRPCATSWAEDEAHGCRTGEVPVGPRNTWSNLAYLAAGLLLWVVYRDLEASVMLASFALLTVGSAAYHAVPGRLTNAWDHAGMYAVFFALVTRAAGGTWLPMLAAAVAGTWVFRFLVRANLNAMMGFCLWIACVAAWHDGVYPLLFGSAVCFLVAMVTWLLDKRRHPWIGRWGHASWHVGTAAAIGLMYAAQGQ